MTMDKILEEINKANSIIILTHENPDGDAMGSAIAMYIALKNYGKNPDIIIPEYSKTFEFLPEINNIKVESDIKQYDLAISVDSATIKMLNGFGKYFENAKSKVVIDHHSTNTMFGDYNYVIPNAPSCTQVILVLLESWRMEVTKDIGTCILTGIITDTGGFQYSSVTAETFEFVAWLLNKGVLVSDIYKKAMNTKTRANFELTRIAIDRIEFLCDGNIAFTYITKEDEEKYEAKSGDHEGIVEIGRSVEGVEVSIFLRDTDKGIKASLRSNDYVNVSDVCLIYGGGGHTKAAGCMMQGDINQIKEKLVTQIKLQLK